MTFSKSIVAVTGLALLASCGNNSTPTVEKTPEVTPVVETTTPVVEPVVEPVADVTTTEHKGKVAYTIPAGEVVAEFEIELDSNGNIVDAGAELVSLPEGDKMSEGMIEHFDEAIDNLVIGKKLSDIQTLDAVTGASVTTDAFKKFASTVNQ